MSTTRVWRVGLLGAARITPPAMIDPAALRDDMVMRVVAARDPARAEAFAAQHGVQRVAARYRDVVTADDVDIVYNALPPAAHAEWTVRALRAGKHVLCEKPLAMNAAQVGAMLAASRATGARLIEAFHYRFHPAFDTYLEWSRDKALGALETVHARFCATIHDDGYELRYRPEQGGGAAMDLGCYPVSWVLETLGASPVAVQARAVRTATGVDRTLAGRLAFANGAIAHVFTDMTPGTQRATRLHARFRHGEIVFDTPITPHNGGRLVRTIGGQREEAPIDPDSTYAHQLAAVCAALESGDSLPCEGPALLRQQRTLDRLYRAAGLGYLRDDMPLARHLTCR